MSIITAKKSFKHLFFFYYITTAVFGYINIYFKGIGLNNLQIGIINSVPRIIAFVILPLWGIFSDYFKANNRILSIALVSLLAVNILFPVSNSFLWVCIMMTLYLSLAESILPLIDTSLLNYLGKYSNNYGEFRVWGTWGYILSVYTIGYIMERTVPVSIFYMNSIIIVITIFFLVKIPESGGEIGNSSFKDFMLLFKNKQLFFFLIFALFIGIATAFYRTYFSIYILDNGGSESLYGLALMVMAVSEISIFRKSSWILDSFKVRDLFLLAAVVYGVRWLILALFPQMLVMISIQLLQSLSYATFHISAVYFINHISGDSFRATGQNFYRFTIGIGAIIGSFTGGLIYDFAGGRVMYLTGSVIAFSAGIIYYLILKHKSVSKTAGPT